MEEIGNREKYLLPQFIEQVLSSTYSLIAFLNLLGNRELKIANWGLGIGKKHSLPQFIK